MGYPIGKYIPYRKWVERAELFKGIIIVRKDMGKWIFLKESVVWWYKYKEILKTIGGNVRSIGKGRVMCVWLDCGA